MDCPKCIKGKIEITTKFNEEDGTGTVKFSLCDVCCYILSSKEMENFILGIEEKHLPPLYVKMVKGNNSIALRLRGKTYWRDAGEWGVTFKKIDDKWLSWHWGYGMPWLHRQKLIEITKKEWRDDNGCYVDDDTKGYRSEEPLNILSGNSEYLPF